MDALTKGDYPFNMRALVKDRLPKFTRKQSRLVKGSFDFIGLNYYTARYVHDLPRSNRVHKSYSTDSCTNATGKLPACACMTAALNNSHFDALMTEVKFQWNSDPKWNTDRTKGKYFLPASIKSIMHVLVKLEQNAYAPACC